MFININHLYRNLHFFLRNESIDVHYIVNTEMYIKHHFSLPIISLKKYRLLEFVPFPVKPSDTLNNKKNLQTTA